MRLQPYCFPLGFAIIRCFLISTGASLLLPFCYIANPKTDAQQVDVKKLGPEEILPPRLYDSYSKLLEVAKDKEKWRKEVGLVSLTGDGKVQELLARQDLTFIAYTKLPSDCHLVRMNLVDLYFVRTKADKYFLYKAVPR